MLRRALRVAQHVVEVIENHSGEGATVHRARGAQEDEKT
jgi:hypothetical protein